MKRKKIVALSLATVMAFSATACGGSSDSGSSTASGTGETTEESGKTRVTMMAFDYNGSPLSGEGSDEVKQIVSDYTNTTFEDGDITWVPSDTYEEKLGLTLLDKDNMPMIITVPNVNAGIVQAAKAGAFWDLSDYIFDAEKYPNLSQANADVLDQVTIGGEIIGIYRQRPIGRYAVGYREDWANKLGIEEPDSMEELYNMAYEFTYGDPDGNGVDDTKGIVLTKNTDSLDMMQVFLGAGNKWVEEDGKLVPVHQTDEYMEALNWMKKMYDEGLVAEDWAVRDATTASDSMKNGEAGIMLDVIDASRRVWDYFETNSIPAVTGEGNASMKLVGTLSAEEGGEQRVLATTGMNGFYAITKAAETEEDLEACLNFLDKMSDDEMLILADYGLEGQTYEINADGYIESLVTGVELSKIPQNGLNQLTPYIPNQEVQSVKVQKTDRKLVEDEIKASNVDYAIFNPAAAYLNDSETYAMNGANLDETLKQARTQYICGEIDEAGLQAKWTEWANNGGQKVIDEVNALYVK